VRNIALIDYTLNRNRNWIYLAADKLANTSTQTSHTQRAMYIYKKKKETEEEWSFSGARDIRFACHSKSELKLASSRDAHLRQSKARTRAKKAIGKLAEFSSPRVNKSPKTFRRKIARFGPLPRRRLVISMISINFHNRSSKRRSRNCSIAHANEWRWPN